jgi:phosphate transport system permease protein
MTNHQPMPNVSLGTLPKGQDLRENVSSRRTAGKVWQSLFVSSMFLAIAVLVILMYTVVNKSFGSIAVLYTVAPADVSDRPLHDLSNDELVGLLKEHMRAGAFNRLNKEKPFVERTHEDILALVHERVLEEKIVGTWTLYDSVFNRDAIDAEIATNYPDATLTFKSWINKGFLTMPMSSEPILAGVRTALLGSLWMILITMLIAFPIGVGAAIYLEEYAADNQLNRIIQTNINNLAGVPSIIYGMLGLAIFVRALEPFSSGLIFGIEGSNGRTIVAASLTMALLVLPIIIINAQEAIRAVPSSLRQASYGLGATKWQTIWHHVLPVSLPGILTGTILAMSRAIGETAPLIVVGASTFIATDPNGPFSKFTVLPIIIYNWTSRPQDEFRNIAAAAIVVLLILLLTLNSIAILLRNRYRKGV